MAILQGSFQLNGLARNAITAKLWSANAFSGSPVYGTALPSGSPLDSTTTSRSHGFDGAYRFTGVEPGEYYVSLTFGGNNTYNYHDIRAAFDSTITEFGAVGDGVTDDRAAFIAADAQGGRILVPAGTYYISGSLLLTQAYFVGDAWGTATLAQKTKLKFSNINASSGAVYTRQFDTLVRTVGMENIYCEAIDWHATSGALGYGFDIEARVTLRNCMSYGFKKSGYFFHCDVLGNGPYHSIIEGCSAERNGNHGFLVGTGANVVTFINPQGRTNGAPSYNTAPSVSGSYDGFHIERDNDGNPGTIFNPKVIEGGKIIGGDMSANSGYGWNFVQCVAWDCSPGYAETNLGPNMANVGAGVTNCTIRFGKLTSDEAGLDLNVAGLTQYRTNQIYVGGTYRGGGNTARYSYLLANTRNYLSSGSLVYLDPLTDAAVMKFTTAGAGVLEIGGSTHVLSISGNVVQLPDTHYHMGLKHTTGTLAPTGGTHIQGERCWNTAPSSGSPLGWLCTSGGTPGTWYPFGHPIASRTILPNTVLILAADGVIFSNNTADAARTYTLPTTSGAFALDPDLGKMCVVKDTKGDAATRNITIQTSDSTTIDGSATFVINQNYGAVTLTWNGTTWSVINKYLV